MTKFLLKFKKPYSWPIFGSIPQLLEQKKVFSKNCSCYTQLHEGSKCHVKIQRNLMIQSQENSQTDVRMEGQTDPIS